MRERIRWLNNTGKSGKFTTVLLKLWNFISGEGRLFAR
jgi:hypothetical protein